MKTQENTLYVLFENRQPSALLTPSSAKIIFEHIIKRTNTQVSIRLGRRNKSLILYDDNKTPQKIDVTDLEQVAAAVEEMIETYPSTTLNIRRIPYEMNDHGAEKA